MTEVKTNLLLTPDDNWYDDSSDNNESKSLI